MFWQEQLLEEFQKNTGINMPKDLKGLQNLFGAELDPAVSGKSLPDIMNELNELIAGRSPQNTRSREEIINDLKSKIYSDSKFELGDTKTTAEFIHSHVLKGAEYVPIWRWGSFAIYTYSKFEKTPYHYGSKLGGNEFVWAYCFPRGL